jgi:hypothetical protein
MQAERGRFPEECALGGLAIYGRAVSVFMYISTYKYEVLNDMYIDGEIPSCEMPVAPRPECPFRGRKPP